MLELRHFGPGEFACRCGCGLGMEQMNRRLLLALDFARQRAGVPFIINSAMRCPAHNQAVGGSPTSAHLSGHAVDIACTGSRERLLILDALLVAGLGRIGIAPGFIHTDNDPSKPQGAVWVYR